MKLVAAQILSAPGEIETNIGKHLDVIRLAAGKGADVVVFPELSLTGYEPGMAEALAVHPTDARLDAFQVLSDRHGMLIAVGAPTKGAKGTEIGMLCFQPGLERTAYSKQHLHPDELAFFSPGTEQRVLRQADHVLAPAICYESLQASHAEHAAELGAQVYLASVAKSERGVASAYRHYPATAKKHSMTVMMANCVGAADSFIGAGLSAIWNRDGERVCSADAFQEALVAYDLRTGEASVSRLA
ncbi:carbon-nitrogen hydrolase family protein [Xanthomonas campestris pv. asclepiadis]|uniref:carbon-nitrogen hydrolase family protein n=1 Tax=Xanthomonas campestris TaxID=339 RepID=UPI001E38FE00|nr:carbon-nitrogen hydrolase family protein [Xanthomonas campestris]MCC4616600.1 carbon-nitrogen hydrolase family protein [Xanthomonas campestris pv. asclepiadis]